MIPWECDGTTKVADLDEICFDRYRKGSKVSRHVYSQVLTCKNGWAVVLVAVQDSRRDPHDPSIQWWDPIRYTVTRWRKKIGWWEMTVNFRFTRESLESLARLAPGFVDESQKRAIIE